MYPFLKPGLYLNIHSHARGSSDTQQFAIINLSPAERAEVLSNGVFSVGIHPWDILPNVFNGKLLETIETAAKAENIIAIGETGLDRQCNVPFELQKEIFFQHLQIANRLHKPVIIHCVKAYSDLLELRKKVPFPEKWIIHGFNENITIGRKLVDLGCFLSFGRHLFNPNSKAYNSFKQLCGNYFFETDNDNLLIENVYLAAAQIKSLQVEQLKEETFNNFSACFLN